MAEQDKYSELFLRITRIAGFLIPFIAVSYGVAVATSYVGRSPNFSLTGFIVIAVLFIILAIAQGIHRPHAAKSLGIYVVLYHVLGAAYIILGPGLTSPISFCWIILTLIAEIFYGRLAAIISLGVLAFIGLYLYLLEPTDKALLVFDYTVYLLVIIISTVLVGLLRSVQRVEHQDFKRTQVQEQLQRGQLTALINSLGAAILSTSSNGSIRIYNAALLSLIDTNQSLSGKKADSVLNLYDENGEPVSLTDIAAKSKRMVVRDDLTHRFEDGEAIRLNISCAPIRGKFTDGVKQHEGYIFIMRDITREKSLEEERNEFISVVSHELRTPITIAEGSLSNMQLLMERGNTPEALAPMLHDAHDQIVYLANMVNDLSTLSRAERGVADDPEAVDIRLLLEELYHRYQIKAGDKGLTLDLDAGHKLGTIVVSRLYLEEILQNFLTNAIKYTQTGTITLIARREGSGITFAVKDTGIGISKSEQKRVFDKFYRSEDYRTRETSGTGLGLYVVRKLAAKLGTHVDIESRLNHGSTFSFVLPDAPAAKRPKEVS